MQYIQGKHPIICQFEPPISEKMHMKPEAVVLEGKYWKRRLESVTAEYKKWRMFWRERTKKESRDDSFIDMALRLDWIESRRRNAALKGKTQQQLLQPLDRYETDEDLYMDLSDTLFSSLNQPFSFPNPREISQLGNADIIQPGLIQLQPSLDEFMDTLEPLPSLSEMMGMTSKTCASPILSMSSGFPRQSPMPMETTLSLNDNSQLLQTDTNDQQQVPEQLQSIRDQAQEMTMRSLQNQGTDVLRNLNNEVHSGLVQNTQIHHEMTESTSEVNALLGNRGNTGLTSQQQKKSFSNAAPQIINLVLNPSLTNQISGQLGSETIQQQPSVIQQQKQQQPVRVSRPTVQQLLNQQQNLQPRQTKTVTIIQNASLQALLQGLSQPSSTVIQPTGISLSPVVESNVSSNVQNIHLKQDHVLFDLGATALDVPAALNLITQPAPQCSISNNMKSSKFSSEGTIQSLLSANKVQASPGDRIRRQSTGSLGAKKDGDFLVPSTTHVPKLRPRNLAPAVSTSNPISTSPNTVLAHLLTQAKHAVAIKQENSSSFGNVSAFKPIQPASVSHTTCLATPPTTSMTTSGDFGITMTSVSDFQRNLLIAAVNQAVGSETVQLSDLAAIGQPITSLSNPSSPQYNCSSPQFILPGSPPTDLEPFRPKNEVERAQYKEMRRASHINAEQKRRGNIKVGFEVLHQIVPSLKMTASSKSSIANTLGKAAEYCRSLKEEKGKMQEEAEILRQEIESLNYAISVCQSQLPATGVPVTRQRADQMREKFDNYVPVLNSLRQLCTTTSILSDPSKVPQQAAQAAQKPGDLSMAMATNSMQSS
ncbi:hypothetical protein LSH36_44g00032 [Paralvinella palmiformis]|uniref:BHLH domain-containing protein n=1 Tax=Paralvinella palmiformis TaxID=53620 RepID=A0AAD9K6S5_9ANNE|nr:hypothetical protein LSH36_44g00032 [Paralvinella palmiformis]